MKRSRPGVLLSAIGAMLLMSSAMATEAGVRIEAREVRNYALPADLDLNQATIGSDRSGTTVITATVGAGNAQACTIIVAGVQGTRSYTYRYENRATACLSAIARPEGGFFVRGALVDDPDAEVFGFTAHIDAEGNEVWAVHDQRLVDAEEVAEGGPGDFLGRYASPHPVLAYSAQFGRLLAFTVGALQIGASNPEVTQAHVINANSGRLQVNGLTFGQSGVGFVAGATERHSDGYFVLYIYSAGSQGAYFYSYNGARSISFFRPRNEDWTQRFVRPPLTYGPDNNLHFLWLPTNTPDSQTHVTVINDAAEEVWSASFGPEDSIDGQAVSVGQAGRLWVGAEHSVLLYQVAERGLHLRVLDAATGRNLGLAPLEGLVAENPIEILTGEQGKLKLLTVSDSLDRIREYELTFIETDSPPPPTDPGTSPDASGETDAGDDEGGSPRRDDDGCGCASAGHPVSGSLFSLLVLAMLYGLRWREDIAKWRQRV
jgi:hypothetical protein